MGIEEGRLLIFYLDSQAFSLTSSEMDGMKLTSLYTLQNGLVRNAEDSGGIDHRHISIDFFFNEASTNFVGDSDLPGSAGSDLLARDESIDKPTVYRGRDNSENLGCLVHGEQFAFGSSRWLVEDRDFPIASQISDRIGSEPFPMRSFSSLPIENSSYDCVGVMNGETTYEVDGFFVVTDGRSMVLPKTNVEFSDSSSTPSKSQPGREFFPFDNNLDLFEEGSQQLFSITISGGRCGSYAFDVSCEGSNFFTFLVGEWTRTLLLTTGEFGFGGRKIAQALVPFGFQSSGHQAIFRFYDPIATFGTLSLITGPFHFQTPLSKRGIVFDFDIGFRRKGSLDISKELPR